MPWKRNSPNHQSSSCWTQKTLHHRIWCIKVCNQSSPKTERQPWGMASMWVHLPLFYVTEELWNIWLRTSVALTDFWHFCISGISWYHEPGLLSIEREHSSTFEVLHLHKYSDYFKKWIKGNIQLGHDGGYPYIYVVFKGLVYRTEKRLLTEPNQTDINQTSGYG
jgi:hypothetical protein